MDGVVGHEVDEVVDVHEGVVDCHDLSLAGVLGEGGAHDETADSSEAVDSHFDL